ncbi:MAG TPA: site-specific integrase [Phycisphaerales bacterium]|nr:site-specific integrase [Phycisphaerales bacterium]
MTSPSRRPKPRRRLPPEVLSPDEVAALIAAAGDSYTQVRTRALIAVLYRSGLRIAEALALYPKDVDPERSSIRVLRGKGGKSRTVGIDAGGLAMLTPWLERRARMGFNGVHPLFCSAWGQPLTTGYIRRMLPALARRAGIAKRVHAHGLRHTHAAELREEGVDIGVISKQLGHTDISTTARYLDHIAPWAVVETVRARHWNPVASAIIPSA